MKEIKAYIRVIKAEDVIHAIEDAGVPGFTAIEVKAIGAAIEPERARYSIDYDEKISLITKIEVVCKDGDVERLVNIIQEKAYTGHRGDGIIFVSDVARAVKIRTGEKDDDALLSAHKKKG